jgi:hypothetical protein
MESTAYFGGVFMPMEGSTMPATGSAGMPVCTENFVSLSGRANLRFSCGKNRPWPEARDHFRM